MTEKTQVGETDQIHAVTASPSKSHSLGAIKIRKRFGDCSLSSRVTVAKSIYFSFITRDKIYNVTGRK